jgi:hypothetical protein
MFFSELPKLLDKDFTVGYLLPAVVLSAAAVSILIGYGFLPEAIPVIRRHPLEVATVLGLASYGVAVILAALNRTVTMLMEGYLPLEDRLPAWLINCLKWNERRLFRGLVDKATTLEQLREEEKISDHQLDQLTDLKRRIAERFPASLPTVLPTSLGNTIRAFEAYPLEMYGLDAIPGWNRLLTVIPKDYRALIDSAKAQMDCWVNLSFAGAVIAAECLVLRVAATPIIMPETAVAAVLRSVWLPIAAIGVSFFSYSMAKSAATEWGDFVKASFDVFLPQLARKLGFPQAVSNEETVEFWRGFSLAVMLREPSWMPTRTTVDKQSFGGSPIELSELRNLKSAHRLALVQAVVELMMEEERSQTRPNPTVAAKTS